MNSLTLTPLAHPVEAELTIPGSKSYTIRALLLAALTPGPVTLINPLFSDDTLAMVRCLNQLGIETRMDNDRMTVHGSINHVTPGEYCLDAQLSAATLRFLIALATILPGKQILHGQPGLNQRPVAELCQALTELGANITYLERSGYPPVAVDSTRLQGDCIQLDGQVSSQYVSALLMIAPLVERDDTHSPLRIEIAGQAVSRPYIDMTRAAMAEFGVQTHWDGDQCIQVPPGQQYQAERYVVEADASSAAYFLALAALTRSRMTINNLNPNSIQADMRFVDILHRMGNRIERQGNRLILTGQGVHALESVNMQDCPDQAQTLAVLAAFAPGVTRIEGIRSLRIKETNRVDALKTELAKMGIPVTDEPDAMTIHGGTPHSATIDTYGDHRMAMAFAVAGSSLPDVHIQNPDVVSKTFPSFWHALEGIGVRSERRQAHTKLILIGFMGAGKSMVAQALSQRLGLDAVDMDAFIVHHSGCRDIAQIFDRDGELRFRELEIATARLLRFRRQAIISTGGGIVMNQVALDYLRQEGTVIHLQASLDSIRERLTQTPAPGDRPLLRDWQQVADLHALRAPLYHHYADHHIATDGRGVDEVVEDILARLYQPQPGEVSA